MLLVGSLLAVQVDQPYIAGVLIGVAAFVKPYALLLLPWLGFTYGAAAACARRPCSPPVSSCRPWSTAGPETSINC